MKTAVFLCTVALFAGSPSRVHAQGMLAEARAKFTH